MKDNDLRPQSFDDYVGQRETIAVMRKVVAAARASGRPCGHLLFGGLPGCGKTTLAACVANAMGTKLTQSVCTAIEHRGELTALLTGLGPCDVLFLDEIHGLDKKLQEVLYSAVEDGVVDLSAGRKMIRLPLQPFTLVGATTRMHLLTGPLRDRFMYTFQLGHYKSEELSLIASRTAERLQLSVCQYALDEIGRRARGTPRIANRLVRACRDFAEAGGLRRVEIEDALSTFRALGVDSAGLDESDRSYLRLLVAAAAPVGLDAITAQLGRERGEIESITEPVLLEAGFMARTPKGRVVTALGVSHLTKVEQEHSVVDPDEEVIELS